MGTKKRPKIHLGEGTMTFVREKNREFLVIRFELRDFVMSGTNLTAKEKAHIRKCADEYLDEVLEVSDITE